MPVGGPEGAPAGPAALLRLHCREEEGARDPEWSLHSIQTGEAEKTK